MIKQYYNGVIHTLSEMGTVAEICMDDQTGKVIAVGKACASVAWAEKIDLKGMCLVPGFCDSHLHVISLGQAMDMVDLTETKSIEEVKTALLKKLQQENPPILRGFGWNQDNWVERRFPTCEDLDQVCSDRPLVMTRVCGHIMCTNSYTVEAMQVDVDKPVDGGAYGIDASGKSNGLFYENARKQIYEFLPRQSVQNLMASICRAQDRLISQGICSVHTNDVRYGVEPHYAHVWEAYKRLEEEGKLKMRFYHQNLVYSLEDMKTLLALGLRTGNGSAWSKQGPYKIMLDGSLGGRTAYLSKPYDDDPSTQGILCYSSSQIRAFYELAESEGQQFIIHAIGDGAMAEVFDAYDAVAHKPGNPLRHGIVHCQITSPEILEAFRKTGMEAYIQPIFLDYDSKIVKDRVGGALESTSYNWRYFYDHGINAPMSSDAPIETTDVLKGIYSAVARRRMDNTPEGGYFPEFKLTVSEALCGYTVAAAYSSFDENVKGRLKVGYYADATILDHDILNCSEEALLTTKVLGTIIAGRTEFERVL